MENSEKRMREIAREEIAKAQEEAAVVATTSIDEETLKLQQGITER